MQIGSCRPAFCRSSVEVDFFKMARLNYSGVAITGGSGRLNSGLGGSVLMKNGVVRNYVTPTNPQTASQSEIRAVFEYLNAQWALLSEAGKLSWESAKSGDTGAITDVFTGTSRAYSSAKAMFIAINTNLLIAAGELDTPSVVTGTPPADVANDTINNLSIVIDASAGTVALTYGGAIVNERIYIRMTPPVSAGNMKMTAVRSQLRSLPQISGASPVALGANYIALFGSITTMAGKKVFYTIEAIGATDGKRRLLETGNVLIVA